MPFLAFVGVNVTSEEKPRSKRRHRKPEPQESEPRRCEAPGCQLPVPTGGRFCVLHEMVEINRRRLEKQAKSRGDLVSQALLFGLSWLGPAITHATQKFPSPGSGAQSSPPPPPPPPNQLDPFSILGLEKGCSESDIRKRQRELAIIFHADKGGGPTASARLAEINAAASACLNSIKSR